MLALDLFNTPFERALNEGAVDDLEARRIHHLNTRMLELMSRANDADFKASPAGLAGLKREYQKLKDERDSYYKVREGSVTPTQTPPPPSRPTVGRQPTVASVDLDNPQARLDPRTINTINRSVAGQSDAQLSRHAAKTGLHPRVKFAVDAEIARRAKTADSGMDEGGIPGNVPTEKIPGKEDLLKGRGRSYYESQKKNSDSVDEGQVSDDVDHRGDVDTKANIEVLGVDLANDTFKITYNGKPYQIKTQLFSQEDLGRWQIADYDVDIINRKGKNIIDLIDWDNDRQVTMVNTIIAYLDTQQAGDIQYMAWRQIGLENSTAEDLYQEIQDFYQNDQQKIDKATAWLAQNMEDTDQRQVFADFVKNPVSRPARTKYIPKEYLMYVAFSYSREGNTELTPGMNLKPIQLDDPDDEEELYRKVDELFKKVQFKFDAFENKIVELADSYGLGSDPDLGSGFGQREIVWDHKTMTTSSSESNKNRQQILANAILNFQAELKKYVESFNNTLIKIGLPGIGEYSTWSGVLGDQLTDQQVRYFDTPEGFANLASGKVDLAKMLDDNVEKLGLKETGNPPLGEKKLGQLRPTLGTGHDIGRSVKKFRAQRGLDEKSTGPLDQKLQRLKVQARRQFPRAHTDDEALVLKLLDKETQDDRENRRVDARQDAELAKNFALDREQDDDIDRLQAGAGMQEHGGGIGPKQRWQDLMPEQMNPEDYEDEDEDEDDRLRSGDYVRDTMDGESGEVFRMQGDPYERRVRILDRDGRGWYIEPSRLTRVDPQDPDIQRYFGKQRVRDMDEGKADYNFDANDLKRLERIRDLPTLKTQALALISRPSAKPMKPEKVEWFKNALDRMNSPIKVIKLMYDLLLSGEGHAVVGSKSSMNPNSYRQRFGEQGVAEGWSDAMVARRTGGPRTPYAVYIKGKKWKDFENEDMAQAVANKLRAKFKADGRDPETVTIAPTDYDQPIKEDQDSSGVERAILNRIMVGHTDLLMKFGPDKVMQAAEEVAYNVGDVDEIGTSDVSAYVAQVKQILGATA